MEAEGIGSSAASRAFGASVNVTVSDTGLYLVVGRDYSPASLVVQAGGEVAMQLSAFKLLASLPFSKFMVFKSDPNIAFIGPVSVDPDRFARFIAMMAQSSSPGNGV